MSERLAIGAVAALVLAGVVRRRGSSNKHFTVTSPAQGLKAIEHQVFRSNHQKSLKVRPSSSTAVLIPCAGTKPFTEAPSHKHGYLPALQGLDVDTYVVAEPLGVVPQAWSEQYPNYAYDFPPAMLKGQARAALVERIAEWMRKVGSKYDRIVAALPQHHMGLVLDANKTVGLELTDASIGACRDSVCSQRSFRATSPEYRKWLRSRVQSRGSRAGYPFMSLGDTLAAEPTARSQDVSKVARSGRGFMRAYESAGGHPTRMGNESTSGQLWTKRRTNFIKRHSAQLDEGWENGEPTRRHLALMMWAYTPTPQRTRQWLRRKGSRARTQTHAMKLPAWSLRLESGTKALKRATKRGDQEQIIAGLEDVSFWVGRSVGDAFGAAGKGGASEAQLRRAGKAILQGEAAIFQAHERLRERQRELGTSSPGCAHPRAAPPGTPGREGAAGGTLLCGHPSSLAPDGGRPERLHPP